MKAQTKILLVAAILLPGGLLFLLIPLAKMLWCRVRQAYPGKWRRAKAPADKPLNTDLRLPSCGKL